VSSELPPEWGIVLLSVRSKHAKKNQSLLDELLAIERAARVKEIIDHPSSGVSL